MPLRGILIALRDGLVLLAVMGTSGCCHTVWIPADGVNHLAPRTAPPEVFLDRLPQRPYRRVGDVQVAGSNRTSLAEFIDEAKMVAAGKGCDILIDSFALEATRVYCKGEPVWGAADCCSRRFVCGAYQATNAESASIEPEAAP